ncbi:hypothetical protein ebA171 [Aromatoleum aromaticum EbN1]|uniref:Uncharacterized protein n=1 Tax=Aromatoleum aromaticum (strain DSM 19018 / LMG 30748 / EbN1) TaxID=76114 RepID=Q5P8Z1_AROAE|nr:hypothetical protein ebA171 [Aromatoleum aromaticum EbN1]
MRGTGPQRPDPDQNNEAAALADLWEEEKARESALFFCSMPGLAAKGEFRVSL